MSEIRSKADWIAMAKATADRANRHAMLGATPDYEGCQALATLSLAYAKISELQEA